MAPMASRDEVVYVVHDRTTSAQPGIHATAYESVQKAIANLDGFRAQQPGTTGPLTWTTGPGWANAHDDQGNPVFSVFGVTIAPDDEPAHFERSPHTP